VEAARVKPDVLGTLALRFALLSLFAVGGTSSILPDAHRVVVDTHAWMTDADFAGLYVLAQAAPGPNVLFFSLLGWKAAGVLGAAVATLALVGPSCTLTFAVSRLWTRGGGGARWRAAVQAGLAPLTVGLLLAAGAVVARASNHDAAAWAVTAVTALVAATTRLNPLWLFAGAAVLGLLGLA
jgi:chromate transporter